jgi:predicted AAA+ superfamily ATPase
VSILSRLHNLSKSNSYFVFGARGVGKSTLLKSCYPPEKYVWFDLLNRGLFNRLVQSPELFVSMIEEEQKKDSFQNWVIVDEIQKIPELLDAVHLLIESTNIKFVLTGSSARKLKTSGANLLAGRAFVYRLYPLTHLELGKKFVLNDVLRFGSLPKVFQLETLDKIEYLSAYTETYLKEEVLSEQIIRQIKPFRLFLNVAAQSSGKILNYSKIARDIDVDPNTVHSYFQILEDTLLGFFLEPFHHSLRKRQRKSAKFYFFDLGVQRALANRVEIPVTEQTYDFGDSFEHFVVLEIVRLAEYRRKKWMFSYLRTKEGAEIDLIIERPGQQAALIEIKSTNVISNLSDAKLNGFKKLTKEFENAEALVFSRDPLARTESGIHFMPWELGIAHLFKDAINA